MVYLDYKGSYSDVHWVRDKLIEDLLDSLPAPSRLRIEEFVHDVGDGYRKIRLLRLYSREQEKWLKGLDNG